MNTQGTQKSPVEAHRNTPLPGRFFNLTLIKDRATSGGFFLLGMIVIAFILLPLITMIVTSDPQVLLSTFLEPEVQQSIWLTITAGLWATLIAAIFGIPLAYVLARRSFWGKGFVEGMIDLPIVIPHTAAGIALLTVFGRKFYGGKFFELFGIHFVGAVPGIVIGMMFVSVPFLIHAARDGFIAVDPRMERVAQTLGASAWQAFWKVSLPLASRSILSGAVMMWARGISEFGAVMILVYHPMVTPILVWNRFETYGLNYAKSVAVILVLICLVIFGGLRALTVKKRET